MSDTRILDIIPENLKEKLISEVEDLIKTRKKKEDEEVSPSMKEWLKAKAEARSKKVNETIKR